VGRGYTLGKRAIDLPVSRADTLFGERGKFPAQHPRSTPVKCPLLMFSRMQDPLSQSLPLGLCFLVL
jgi:hypothetical protein